MVSENELMSVSDLHFLADFWRMAVSRALRQFERHAASCLLGSERSNADAASRWIRVARDRSLNFMFKPLWKRRSFRSQGIRRSVADVHATSGETGLRV